MSFEGEKFWGKYDKSKKSFDASGLLMFRGKDQRILLGKRENVLNPGSWGIFGGKLEEGENAEEAAIRETEEEIGSIPEGKFGDKYRYIINLVPEDFIINLERHAEEGERFIYTTFLYIVSDDSWTPRINWEHEKLEWFPINDLPKNLLYHNRPEGRRYALKEAVDHLLWDIL